MKIKKDPKHITEELKETENKLKKSIQGQLDKEESATNNFLNPILTIYTAITSILAFIPYNQNLIVDGIYQKTFYIFSLLLSSVIVFLTLFSKYTLVKKHREIQQDIVNKRNAYVEDSTTSLGRFGPITSITRFSLKYLNDFLIFLLALQILCSILFALSKLI